MNLLTSQNFTKEISSGDSLVIFSFVPSSLLTGILANLSFFPRTFVVNIEEERDLAAKYNIRISPIVYRFKDGEAINTYKLNEIEALICILKS